MTGAWASDGPESEVWLINISEPQNLHLELGTYTDFRGFLWKWKESVSVNYPYLHISLPSESRGSTPSHSPLHCSVVFSSEHHLYLKLSWLLIFLLVSSLATRV